MTSGFAGVEEVRRLAEQAAHWRAVGAALDGLVRSARIGDPALPKVADHLLGLWRRTPEAMIRIAPTGLNVDDQVALTSSQEAGRWLLPAFMAGLRGLRLRPTTRAEELVHFGEELSALEANIGTITRFSDWLWSDGAQGFDVDLHASFVEVMDTVMPEAGREQNLLATRSANAVASWNETVWIASKELDAAAAREEFEVPLELLVDALKRFPETFAMAGADAERLRTEAENAASWSAAEVDAIMDHPELRASMPAQRLARRLAALVQTADAIDGRLLEFVSLLVKREDPYSRAVVMALEKDAIGAVLGTKVRTDKATLENVRIFLTTAPPTMASGVVHALLKRAATETGAQDAIRALGSGAGLQKFMSHVDPANLAPAAATALARMLVERLPHPTVMRDLLDRLPPRAVCAILAALPDTIPIVRMRVTTLLTETPDEAREVVKAMLASRRPDDLRQLAEVLPACDGRGWPLRLLTEVLAMLVAVGLGEEVIPPLVRSRGAALEVRLAALDAATHKPALLAEAVKRRSAELLDPPELRARLQETRRRLKAAES